VIAVDLCAVCAEKVRKAKKARRARRLARSLPSRKARAATREERRAESAEIRAAVFLRAGARCEVPNCPRPPDEWHHIASGSNRRLEEAEDSTCAICIPHHRLAQAGDRETLRSLLTWAIGRVFRPAVRALEHRISKIDEARRST